MLYCPSCKNQTPAFDNRNAAVVSWALTNRKGDDQVLGNWIKNFKLQFPEQESKAEAA